MTGAAAAILAVAIALEVMATSALKLADGFSKPLPSAVAIVGYALAFYCISLTLRTSPIGVVYGVWCGVGIVLVSAVGWLWFGEKLDVAACVGIALIVAGVLVINLMSASVRT